ncbi:MAG: hypothetical protein JXB25_03020 [Deltaproteobacteria bacterium]|nr:hypothetical protein [Deltaproteobacteria bacterium]
MNQQIDLYRQFAPRKKGYSPPVSAAMGLAAVAAALVLVYLIAMQENRALNREFKELTQKSAMLAESLRQIPRSAGAQPSGPALEKEILEMTRRIADKERLLEKANSLRRWQMEGFSGYLVHLGGKNSPGLWLNRIAIREGGAGLVLAGSALAPELIPGFIQEMAGDERFAFLKTAVLQLKRPAAGDVRVDFVLEAGGGKRP